jgi:predicted RNA binding protein YcfA (HicA-like mRNA interferase family)
MPPKVRQLEAQLRRAGFTSRPGKGSHIVWFHPRFPEFEVTLSGHSGDDARDYQVNKVRKTLARLAETLQNEESRG